MRYRFTHRIHGLTWLIIIFSVLTISCNVYRTNPKTWQPSELINLYEKPEFLKAHLKNGNVAIFSEWQYDDPSKEVRGIGKVFDPNRLLLDSGPIVVELSSVSIFESNVLSKSPSVSSLSVMTGLSLVGTILCITNPKACFGSCPTFYAETSAGRTLVAEAFSSSVAPALEADDIDALYHVNPSGEKLYLNLTNEALETHVIRKADILAVPRYSDERIYMGTDDEFIVTTDIIIPSHADIRESDVTDLIRVFDFSELYTQTDSFDLAAKDTLELSFEITERKHYGLVIASRQTLLSTYLFYQMLSYLGENAAGFLGALSGLNQPTDSLAASFGRQLGGIELFGKNSGGEWIFIDEINETGPLATDVRIIPIPDSFNMFQDYRLIMTKGHWRIDYAALAEINGTREPLVINPTTVFDGDGINEKLLGDLVDTGRFIVTQPGDSLVLEYRLPAEYDDYELFLHSRGYYLEWMREDWLAEENNKLAIELMMNPSKAMKQLAPEYKKIEADMEEIFWNSRYVR